MTILNVLNNHYCGNWTKSLSIGIYFIRKIPTTKDSRYSVTVKWSNGETIDEPLFVVVLNVSVAYAICTKTEKTIEFVWLETVQGPSPDNRKGSSLLCTKSGCVVVTVNPDGIVYSEPEVRVWCGDSLGTVMVLIGLTEPIETLCGGIPSRQKWIAWIYVRSLKTLKGELQCLKITGTSEFISFTTVQT